MNNELREVKGFEGLYSVDREGNVWSYPKKKHILKGKFLIPFMSEGKQKGYHYVTLMKENKKCSKKVHRLVAEAFIPNPDNLPEVNHKNAIKTCNKVWNLEWNTKKQNNDHAIKLGLYDNAINARKISVSCIETKVVYSSLTEASKYTGIDISNISAAIHNKQKKAGGFTWKVI